jgi:hypothetical protein
MGVIFKRPQSTFDGDSKTLFIGSIDALNRKIKRNLLAVMAVL